MARARTKSEKVGYSLRVKEKDDTGKEVWRGVGYIFKTRFEAKTFHSKRFSHLPTYTIQGVRVNVEPVKAPLGRTENEK